MKITIQVLTLFNAQYFQEVKINQFILFQLRLKRITKMSKKDLDSLTCQDLKLITIIAYRTSLRSLDYLRSMILPHLKQIQSSANGLFGINSSLYSYFQKSLVFGEKVISKSSVIDRIIKNQFQEKKFSLQSFGNFLQKKFPKFEINQSQTLLQNPNQANSLRSEIIKDIEIKKGHEILSQYRSSALLSVGSSALINIKTLLNGKFQLYFTALARDTVIGISKTAISSGLSDSVGDVAGPLSSFIVGSLCNTYGLMKTGDWSRFGLSSLNTAVGVSCGYLGGKGGAMFGTTVWPGPGTVIGGVIGGMSAAFLGKILSSKVVSSNDLTNYQKQFIKNSQDEHMEELAGQLKKEMKENGQDFNEETLANQLENGKIEYNQKSIVEIYKVEQSFLTKKMIPFYRETIIPFVLLAKGLSQTGNISEGLRILDEQTNKWV